MDKQRVSCEKYEDVENQDVKVYCATTQFPELISYGTHNKPYCVQGWSDHYKMRFDTKLGHCTCVIHRTTWPCTQFSSTLEKN